MKFIRLDLLTLLISLFILNSCKNRDDIGLGVTAANQLNGSLIDTSTIFVNTIPEEQVTTTALSSTPLAYFKDPVFGTTEANVVLDLNLPFAPYTVPTGTLTIDSALLILRYAPGFYGDSIASRYKVNVYQLNERLYSSSAYSATKQWKYNPTLLGTKSFFSRTHDSTKIITPIVGAPDTLVKVPPQLRIPINASFVNNILFNASPALLKSNLVFKNNVNGLYVTLDKNQTGPGGTFMMALDSGTVIQVYYKTVNGTVVDTASVSLTSSLHAAEVKHTYSTAVQTALNNTTTFSKTVYLQGLTGLRSKISFPYLKNIQKSLGTNIIINRAELVITAVPGTTTPFAPLPKLSMYRYDLANQRILVQDNSSDPRGFGPAAFGGFYNSTQQQYHFLITGYIQDLMRGVTTDLGTYIGPTTFDANTTITPTVQIDGRTIAVGFDKTSQYSMKLNIIYTKLFK